MNNILHGERSVCIWTKITNKSQFYTFAELTLTSTCLQYFKI